MPPAISVTSALALGVDVGGTKTRVGVVDSDGALVMLDEVPTAAEGGADPGLRRSLALARVVAEQADAQGLSISAIGVGVPEYVDATGLLRSRDVIGWDVQPLQVFSDLGPLTVESDVRCGALAESAVGAGRDVDSMLYASIGTGISCSLVIAGRPWSGHRGDAIALGELPVQGSIDSGASVTVEEFASGAAIARRYERMTEEIVTGAADVVARAAGHDTRAAGIVESSAMALGAALAWAVHLMDPERVVLGGGLGASGGHWAEVLCDSYAAHSRPDPPPLITAALGANSAVVGAGLVALAARDAAAAHRT